MACVKTLRSGISKQYAHVAGQISVNCVAKSLRTHLAPKFKAGDLPFGVHAGIGAARSLNDDFAIIKQRQDAAQLSLDGAQAILHLPAVKISTVVLDE